MKKIILFLFLFAGILQMNSQTKNYPLTINFYSVCCGTPDDNLIKNTIKTFKKQYKIKTIKAFHVSKLGKEGEHAYVFILSELNNTQRKNLILKLQKTIAIWDSNKTSSQGGYSITENVDPSDWKALLNDKTRTKIVAL